MQRYFAETPLRALLGLFMLLVVGLGSLRAQADLTVLNPQLVPATVGAGGTSEALSSVYNRGVSTAASSSLGYFLSPDAVFDASDVLLVRQPGPALYSSQSWGPYNTLTIPAGTAPGSYYVLFVADDQNQVAESDETNNVRAVALAVALPVLDLVVQQEQVYSPTLPGYYIRPNCTLLNQGNMPAASSTVGFYLSTNPVLDATDVLLATVPGPSLGAGQQVAREALPTIPANTAPGSYYMLFVADPQNQVAETDETNNVRSLPLVVQVPTIDLRNSYVYLNALNGPAVAGSTLTGNSYLDNRGNYIASPATLGCYLSTDQTLDAADVLVGTSTGFVNGGSSVQRFTPITIPLRTAAGSYYVLFVADYLNELAETDETNNVASHPLQVATPIPDLVPLQVYLSPVASAPGSALGANFLLKNQGTGTAASSPTGYYLSTDAVFDAADVPLLTEPGGLLAVGQTVSRSTGTIPIPTGVALGSYYVLLVADPLNAVAESDETNNVTSRPFQLTAPFVDLLPVRPELSVAMGAPGTALQATCQVLNQGNIASATSSLGIFLSANTVFDVNDVRLTIITGPGLNGPGGIYLGANVVVPTGTPAGSYYVLFVADPLNGQVESDETNNVLGLPFAVAPPLNGSIVPIGGTATTTSCSTTIYDSGGRNDYADNTDGALTLLPATAGALVRLEFTVFATEAGYDFVSVYDGTSTSAPLLGSYSGTQLPLPLTASNVDGALTVRFSSDANTGGAGFEATASCVAATLSDLLLTQIGASPSTVPVGGTLSLSATVANQGATPANASAVGFYLSTDQALSADDVPLGTSPGGALGVGLTASRPLAVPVPASTAPGSYYVLFVADPLNAVAETNEANNLAALRLSVTQATASREATAGYTVAVAPNPVASGQPLLVQLVGAGPEGQARVALYNALGQCVQTQPLVLRAGSANRAEIATQGLASGVYTLRLTGSGLSVTRRVMVE